MMNRLTLEGPKTSHVQAPIRSKATASIRHAGAADPKAVWRDAVRTLPPELQPVVDTFGDIVMEDSGAVEFKPRYPHRVEDVPRYPLPSNPAQMRLAEKLKTKLEKLGLSVRLDEHYNVIGELPGNLPLDHPHRSQVPVLALKAHLDTTYEQPNTDVMPKLHTRFDGKPLVIAERNSQGQRVVLDPADTPALRSRMGQDIITASGDTLLGADAKAGIAEILEALRQLQLHNRLNPQKPLYHPDLRVVFTVDEESNLLGARTLDLKRLGADYAIDLDDTDPGRINVRSYHGHNVNINIKARSVHTAELATMKMANPMMIASEIASRLPKNQLLENKSGSMRGYIYLDQLTANWHEANMLFLVRDFDCQAVQKRVQTVLKTAQQLQAENKGRPAQISWRIEEEYANPAIDSRSPFVRQLTQSARSTGIKPQITEFRGCTDAAVLTDRGLPTVVLGCGWQNAHQLTEWVTAQDLYAMSRYLLNVITQWPTTGPKKTSTAPKDFKPLGWPKITVSDPQG